MQDLKKIRKRLRQEVDAADAPIKALEYHADDIKKEAKRRRLCLLQIAADLRKATELVESSAKTNLYVADLINGLFNRNFIGEDLALGRLFDTITQKRAIDLLRVIKKHEETTSLQQAEAPCGVDSRLYELIRGKIKDIVDVCYETTLESHPYLATNKTDHDGEFECFAGEKVYLLGSAQDGAVKAVEEWRRPDYDAFALLNWANANRDGFPAADFELATVEDKRRKAYAHDSLTLKIPAVLVFVNPLEPLTTAAGDDDGESDDESDEKDSDDDDEEKDDPEISDEAANTTTSTTV
ncbi:uncharacterized protein ACA1_363270 [Acanthamoeba castellanii str. Neff]|uniref:Uncharacterized protein n=1 Tax=Acanthamoeba castellanii (strain ATCC 30010 / Neff) TaxID=1257118 RepID=L8GGF2_ACACF|nr:uncharacterized protein ACA1_363270 [Acanthamoeba castellanii str. Neff]ELR11828.1 hypothetical protein ACA1_363270 [Acanthamoeba castellanii str. Neff]